LRGKDLRRRTQRYTSFLWSNTPLVKKPRSHKGVAKWLEGKKNRRNGKSERTPPPLLRKVSSSGPRAEKGAPACKETTREKFEAHSQELRQSHRLTPRGDFSLLLLTRRGNSQHTSKKMAASPPRRKGSQEKTRRRIFALNFRVRPGDVPWPRGVVGRM